MKNLKTLNNFINEVENIRYVNEDDVQFAKDMLNEIKHVKNLLPKAEKACKSLIADPTLLDNDDNPEMRTVAGLVEACNNAANGEAGQYFYD